MRRLTFPAMLRLTLLLLATIPVHADWAQWRGPEGNGHTSEKAPDSLPASPKVLWHIAVGNSLSSPVVAGGRVVHLDNTRDKEVVHCLDAATGRELWQRPIDEAFKDSQSQPGPRCTPVIDGDRVYAQSCRGELQCLSLADGKVIWQTNFVNDFGAVFIGEKGTAEGATRHGNNGSPLVDGDHLIVQVGGKGACIVGFDKRTGKVIWKSQEDTPAYASPVLASIQGVRQFISFAVQGVIALDPADGKLLWRVPITTRLGRHVTTPVVSGDFVVVSSHTAGLIGIKVEKDGAGLKAAPAWTKKDLAINFASPVAVGPNLFGIGPQANLMCVDIASGKLLWSENGLFAGRGGSAYGGFMVLGKNVMMLSDRGELVLFAADASGFKPVSKVQICGQNWCNAAYTGGILYLRDHRELSAIQIVP